MRHRAWLRSVVLLGAVVGLAAALTAWKYAAIETATASAANQPEPAEAVVAAVAEAREHADTTTSIGTVVALRSITLRNELPGTVRRTLRPGTIAEAGEVLVALDVAVEEAELRAQLAQAELAETTLTRIERMHAQRAASQEELDRARAERDVALAQIARTKAVIERKTMRAPFRGRVGIADVHPGQYLDAGSYLTTLQGVDDAAYVDFAVPQQVAAALRKGEHVQVYAGGRESVNAAIVAIDARVDPETRNATIRARLDAAQAPAPGASVRVQTPVGEPTMAVSIPASALRKGPGGDYVFVLENDEAGQTRARVRHVRIATAAGDEVIVRDGLSAGEKVAASGSFKLRDSALVAVLERPEAVAFNARGASGEADSG